MLEFNNSKEREAGDWVHLFKLADERFTVADIKRPSSSKLSFVEVVWKERSIPSTAQQFMSAFLRSWPRPSYTSSKIQPASTLAELVTAV